MTEQKIEIKRVYQEPEKIDGIRFLVDRLWPRGISKEHLKMDGWLKDVAPSPELRKWFGHNPDRWEEFQQKYLQELREHPEAWERIVATAREQKVTLLYAAKDEEHNNAVVLRNYLRRKK